ncbi:hypothetical protein DL96DRAFT_1607612 [Flagelloscypha sp. PMI_526]|nr:hypothetical protein DL96DRAFT_1607612 [Flagelloscypha sp. PMI_526]
MPTLTVIRLHTEPRFSQEQSLKETLVLDYRWNASAPASDLSEKDLWSEMVDRLRTSTNISTTSLELLGDSPLPPDLQEALLSAQGLPNIETLAIETGWDEELDLSFLPISNPWPIKTLQIGSSCSGDIPSHILLHLKSLSLNCCLGQNFSTAPPTETAGLERLEIIENDVLSMFVAACDTSCLTRSLTYLSLQYTNSCDYSDHDDFWVRLNQVTSLRTLVITIFEQDDMELRLACQKTLPRSVPSGLTAFYFTGSPWISDDLSVWNECIEDVDGWLPNLQRFGCELNLVTKKRAIKEAKKAKITHSAILEEAEERVKTLVLHLRTVRPNIRIELEE